MWRMVNIKYLYFFKEAAKIAYFIYEIRKANDMSFSSNNLDHPFCTCKKICFKPFFNCFTMFRDSRVWKCKLHFTFRKISHFIKLSSRYRISNWLWKSYKNNAPYSNESAFWYIITFKQITAKYKSIFVVWKTSMCSEFDVIRLL